MKKILALITGFVVSSTLYLLVTTVLFNKPLADEIPPAVVCGVGSMAIITLFFNRRRLQPIPVRVKRF
jgi:hypothetical protein